MGAPWPPARDCSGKSAITSPPAVLRVRVFSNLTRRCYSIQATVPEVGWRTIAHASHVQLTNATFFVSETARQRVLRTKKRTVHAAIQADLGLWVGRFAKDFHDTTAETLLLMSAANFIPTDTDQGLRYSLWGSGTFELAPIGSTTWHPALRCAAVCCTPGGVTARVL
jgi:hypothetical protein